MIDWKDYFDHIYCLHHIPYKDRLLKTKNELKRLGILDSSIFSWHFTYPSLFDMALAYNLKMNPIMNDMILEKNKPGLMNVCLGHYQIIKEAQAFGFEHILVLEDDNIYYKNIDYIDECLKNMPEDYDCVLFNRYKPDNVKMKDFNEFIDKTKVNDYFFEMRKEIAFYSNSFLGMSKKMINFIAKQQEKEFAQADAYVNCNDIDDEDKALKRYAVINNLAIQGAFAQNWYNWSEEEMKKRKANDFC